jgi:hypothetical protein
MWTQRSRDDYMKRSSSGASEENIRRLKLA